MSMREALESNFIKRMNRPGVSDKKICEYVRRWQYRMWRKGREHQICLE